MDTKLSNIINDFWGLYVKYKDKEDSPIVDPSIPILWFGDLNEYMKSHRKVVTLAINPSSDEFRLKKQAEFNFIRFKEGEQIYFKRCLDNNEKATLSNTLNGYFTDTPYSWFKGLETPLNCINTTFGGKVQNSNTIYKNQAIHIDLCPLATTSKWKDVPREIQKNLKDDFKPLLNDLIEYLKPDVIVASISQDDLKSIFNLHYKNDAITNFENGNGGFVRNYLYNETEIIIGRNMRGTPFGSMSHEFIKDSLKQIEDCNQR